MSETDPEIVYSYFDVAETDEIEHGKGKAYDVDGRMIAVFNNDGIFYAIEDSCPHMGASLATGYMHNCVVSCPWHAWRFDVRNGSWVDNPRIHIDSFPVRVVNSRIQVGTPMPSANEPALPHGECKEETHASSRQALTLADFQKLIHKMYYEKDVARGVEGTFMWLMEEVGELSSALRERDRKNQLEEFADVLAWLCTIANVCDIDLTEAIRLKYGSGCPGCHRLVCDCPDTEKP